MARFGPARALKRLVAEHSQARRTGMPVAEYREARREAQRGNLPRRELLRLGLITGGTAATAGLTGFARRPEQALGGGSLPRIAVIGAGLAGLNTALTLRDADVGCTVYEAADRVGGRVFSERGYWDHGQVSEWGGELIDRDHHAMHRLCRRYGLDLVDVIKASPKGSEEVFHVLGDYYSRARADEDFAPVYQRLRDDLRAAGPTTTWRTSTPAGVALSRMSLHDWIDNRVPGGHASPMGQFIDVAYTVEYGADTTEQTALNLVYLMSYQHNPEHFSVWGLSDERYHIVGGNQQLPERIAADLPDGTVRHGWCLLAITRNADGTQTLTFDVDGRIRTRRVDHTVLAVPLGVLQRLDLSRAGLDQRKRKSIAAMRMGACTKLNMQLDSRPYLGEGPWPGVSNGEWFTDTGFQQVWDATRGQRGHTGILIQYGAGSCARAVPASTPFSTSADPTTRLFTENMLASIDKVLPDVRESWLGKSTFSAWHVNPLSHGAYSYWPTEYAHRYGGYEAVRQGNIHFAAEHTSVEYQGFMNGAVLEGQRAARHILADIRGAPPA